MITLFTSETHNSSHRQVIKFFEENGIEYVRRRVTKENTFTEEELMSFFESATDIHEVISNRTKIYKEAPVKIEEMHLKSELIPYIQENPSICKFPIILKDRYIQTGYTKEEIRNFVPKAVRKKELQRMLEQIN